MQKAKIFAHLSVQGSTPMTLAFIRFVNRQLRVERGGVGKFSIETLRYDRNHFHMHLGISYKDGIRVVVLPNARNLGKGIPLGFAKEGGNLKGVVVNDENGLIFPA